MVLILSILESLQPSYQQWVVLRSTQSNKGEVFEQYHTASWLCCWNVSNDRISNMGNIHGNSIVSSHPLLNPLSCIFIAHMNSLAIPLHMEQSVAKVYYSAQHYQHDHTTEPCQGAMSQGCYSISWYFYEIDNFSI